MVTQLDGPAQEEKQFGIHPNSVDATLHQAPKAIRDLYARNRREFMVDQALMKRWAEDGFVSTGGDTTEAYEEAA